MAVCPPYYSVDPRAGAFYHNNSSCPVGRKIMPQYLREGVGIGRSLCEQCVQADIESWTDRPLAPDYEEGE